MLIVEDENLLMESYEGNYFFNNCTFIGYGDIPEAHMFFYDANALNVTNSIFTGFRGIANIGVDITHCLFNNMQIDSNHGYSGDQQYYPGPLFCDAENGNYGLAANSPALGSDSNGSNIGALGATCSAIYHDGPASPFLTIQYAIDNATSGSNTNNGSLSLLHTTNNTIRIKWMKHQAETQSLV